VSLYSWVMLLACTTYTADVSHEWNSFQAGFTESDLVSNRMDFFVECGTGFTVSQSGCGWISCPVSVVVVVITEHAWCTVVVSCCHTSLTRRLCYISWTLWYLNVGNERRHNSSSQSSLWGTPSDDKLARWTARYLNMLLTFTDTWREIHILA